MRRAKKPTVSPSTPRTAQLSVRIPERLMIALKTRAVQKRTPLKSIIESLIAKFLDA